MVNCHFCKQMIPDQNNNYRLIRPTHTGNYIKNSIFSERGKLLYTFTGKEYVLMSKPMFVLLCGHVICLDCGAKNYSTRNKHIICCHLKDPFMTCEILQKRSVKKHRYNTNNNQWEIVNVDYNVEIKEHYIIRTPWDIIDLIMKKFFS